MSITISFFRSKAPKAQKVCIAKKAPRFFTGLHIKPLAPSNPFIKEWQQSYRADLESRFPNGAGLAALLEEIQAKIADPILCCYEDDPADCHRHILADYINAHLGLTIAEWKDSTNG